MQKVKGYFLACFYAVLLLLTVINPISIKIEPAKSCTGALNATFPSIQKFIKNLFHKEEKINVKDLNTQVYLGGYPLGFTLNLDGVLVVAISNDNTENLKEGDIIHKINGYEVCSADDVSKVLNENLKTQNSVDLTISRNGELTIAKICPIFDEIKMRYKLGLWIRDNAAGVGTLTYIKTDDLRFGALGHPVCDIDTGSLMPVSNGNIFKCNVVGVKKGIKGNPGELKGLFLRNRNVYGELDSNKYCGVFGKYNAEQLEQIDKTIVPVAPKSEIKSGKAKIRCTLDGYEPKEYDIEIVKIYFQTTNDNKSMFIRVTDPELIEKTGGIVQGMSGSPIIQNGKLVGAVTHVFVSDPTKGYGIFAEEMIKN